MTENTPDMTYISYNHMHKLCQQSAVKLREADKMPDIIVAISGGGLIPARMLRTFLKKEVELAKNSQEEKKHLDTEFSVFVLYNKLKPKKKQLPDYIMDQGRYIVASDVDDSWLCFPYDSTDIDLHTKRATEQGNI